MNTLANLRGGRTLSEIENGLAKIVQKVRETGKQGKITLTIKVDVAERETWDEKAIQVTLHDDVDVKIPKPARTKSVFFADQTGRLTRHDPAQRALFPDPDGGEPSVAEHEEEGVEVSEG